jgi:hypothetical protein
VSSIQYRVVVAKKDERTNGPDGFDPTVAFMRGKLKASGNTGDVLEALKSGVAATAIANIVATIE